MTEFGFPYRVAATGGTATASPDQHVRDLIALVLFTGQGERVNRPDFGSGARQLVHSQNAPELAMALQHLVLSSLQRWLSDLIEVRGVEVEAHDATLSVEVRFRPLDSDQERSVQVVRQA
ncbi:MULTISPECIES: GPW/gp25 family protein [unclassified Devosia]|uniref:GPW/gp25 family protein n=1 Tax=unclassified Devosia TaxID=196773 RepID=UPI001AC3FE22|nr:MULTISPECIES: GPW/gp25 family protein [unclassified Devosia]MBN9364477.1 GPW/gp25 family protein [Devosia sp.]